MQVAQNKLTIIYVSVNPLRNINLIYTAGGFLMKEKELTEYLCTEIKEINQYVIDHPELSREDASKEWVKRYAAEFSKKWKETHTGT